MTPKYSLTDVKKLAKDPDMVIVQVSRALDTFMFVMKMSSKDRQKAKLEILKGLQKLRPECFCERKLLPTQATKKQEIYDVYALLDFHGYDWYVKFRIDGKSQLLINVSFHLPDYDMWSPDGRLLCRKY